MTDGKKTYRLVYKQADLKYFQVLVEETDLYIGLQKDKFSTNAAVVAENIVKKERKLLERYLVEDPGFLTTLVPHELLPGAPPIAQTMAAASLQANTGPMSAVAGALSEIVAVQLAGFSDEVIVENGGDIYVKITRPRRIGVFAGTSPFSNSIAIEISPEHSPVAVCTSSGTVGHAFSLGTADAAVVLSRSGALADAVATAAANFVHTAEDLMASVEFAMGIDKITGVLVIKDDKIALAGNINLVPTR
ncbi:MAG TPA: UPF0280 family protein [Clostridia bacterium]|nr:UPF0280 family protein [Clostridia bacterium]